jgi:hypothetical protein
MIHDKGNSFRYNDLPSPSYYLDIILVDDITNKSYLSVVDNVCKPPKRGLFSKNTYKVYEIDKKEKSFLKIIKLQTEHPKAEFSVEIKFKYKVFNSEIFWNYYMKIITEILTFEEILENKIREDTKDFFKNINIKFIESKILEFESFIKEKQIDDLKNRGINISDLVVNIEISSELKKIIEKCRRVYDFNKKLEIITRDYNFIVYPNISFKIVDNDYLIQNDKLIEDRMIEITKELLSQYSKSESGVDYKIFESNINISKNLNILKENFAIRGFNTISISFKVKPCDKISNLDKEGRFEFRYNLDSKDDVIGKFKFLLYFYYKIIDIPKFLNYGSSSVRKSIEKKLKRYCLNLSTKYYICEIKNLNEEINNELISSEKTDLFNNFKDEYGINLVSLSTDIDVNVDSEFTYISKKHFKDEFHVTSKTDEYRFKIGISANYNFVRPANLEDLNDENIEKMLKTNFKELIQKKSYEYETKNYIELEKELNKFIYDKETKELLKKDGFTINKYHILIIDADIIGPGKQIPRSNSIYAGKFEMEIQDEINGSIFIRINYTFEITKVFYKAVEDYKKIIEGFLNVAFIKYEKEIKDYDNWHMELKKDVEELKKNSIKDKNIELVTYAISISNNSSIEKEIIKENV